MDSFVVDWQQIRTQLEEKKAGIYEEIANYPPPIPACDQQFNYLLEERTKILQELKRLDAMAKQANDGHVAEAINAFITESAYLNGAKLQEK